MKFWRVQLVWIVWTVIAAFGSSLPSASAAERTILVYGDSLSAAYGISQKRGWVTLLGERLKEERANYSVVNASISGETTAGGASRIDKALATHRPSIVVIELGANDGLRGLPITQMKANLAAMVNAAHRAQARVVLVGMRMPPNYGAQYTREFHDAFAEIARTHKTSLVPFLLAPIVHDRTYFQSDGVHPTAAAQPLLLETVWKELKALIRP